MSGGIPQGQRENEQTPLGKSASFVWSTWKYCQPGTSNKLHHSSDVKDTYFDRPSVLTRESVSSVLKSLERDVNKQFPDSGSSSSTNSTTTQYIN